MLYQANVEREAVELPGWDVGCQGTRQDLTCPIGDVLDRVESFQGLFPGKGTCTKAVVKHMAYGPRILTPSSCNTATWQPVPSGPRSFLALFCVCVRETIKASW